MIITLTITTTTSSSCLISLVRLVTKSKLSGRTEPSDQQQCQSTKGTIPVIILKSTIIMVYSYKNNNIKYN